MGGGVFGHWGGAGVNRVTYKRRRGLELGLCIWFALGEGLRAGWERRGEEFRPLLISLRLGT